MTAQTGKRNRNIQLKIYVDEDEFAAIEGNMKRAKIKKKSDYIRQMILFGKVIYLDDMLFRKCYNELYSIGINLNQMAKIANETGSIFNDDIEFLKESCSAIVGILDGIFYKTEELLEAVKKSKFETLSEKIKRISEDK